jgi:nucleoside recognition membrane protein YjiH
MKNVKNALLFILIIFVFILSYFVFIKSKEKEEIFVISYFPEIYKVIGLEDPYKDIRNNVYKYCGIIKKI